MRQATLDRYGQQKSDKKNERETKNARTAPRVQNAT